MAKKTIGGLYVKNTGGAGYFLKYCPKCKDSIYWNGDEAQEFIQNASRFIHIKKSLFFIMRQKLKLPKIRIEWGSNEHKTTTLLTNSFEKNTIENMKLKQTIFPNQKSERNKKILEKRATGLSISELGKIFGLTRQRIFVILQEYGDTLPKELSTSDK